MQRSLPHAASRPENAGSCRGYDFTGFDCGKIRSAAGWGAAFGAAAGAARSTGRQCFAAGTEIATEEGPKAIEKVAVGDRVLSRSEDGELSYEPVTRLFVRGDAEEVRLTFTDSRGAAGSTSIVTTPEHPFRVATGEWVAAGRLDIGDNIVTAEGGLATLSAALSLEKRGTVYNFEVAGTHTYFVGDAKLWVHNNCQKVGRGRGANNLKPDPTAQGAHSTYKTDGAGQVTNHAEWSSNPQNPSGFDLAKRVDVTGKGHYNPTTGSEVPTPHTHDGSAPGGVRSATADEVPSWWKRRP